jgi:hypothetical protein
MNRHRNFLDLKKMEKMHPASDSAGRVCEVAFSTFPWLS